MSVQNDSPSKILVFLPQPAARAIVGRLGEHGYASTAVSTVPEAFDALRSDTYCLAITTRMDIALLRNIRALPVVNLEIFFHADPADCGVASTSKKFDSRAFMERVEFLVQPVPSKGEPAVAATQKASENSTANEPRWWSAIKESIGRIGHRPALTDAHS